MSALRRMFRHEPTGWPLTLMLFLFGLSSVCQIVAGVLWLCELASR